MSLLSHFSVLHFKISSLEEGEVVDVNKLNPRTGAGAKIRTLPTRGPNVAIAKIYASGTLPIFATTQEALEKALPLVPKAMREKNQECLERLYQYFQGTTETHVVTSEDTSVSVASPKTEAGDVEITIPPAKARGRSAKPKAPVTSVPKSRAKASTSTVVAPEQVTTKVPTSVPKGAAKASTPTTASATKTLVNPVPKGLVKSSTPTTTVVNVNIPEQVVAKIPINPVSKGVATTSTTSTTTVVDVNVPEQVVTKVPVNPVPKGVTTTSTTSMTSTTSTTGVINVNVDAPEQVVTKIPTNPVPKGITKTPVTALGKAKALAKSATPSIIQSKTASTSVDTKTSTSVDAKPPLTPFGVPSKAPKGRARTKKVSEPVATQHEKIQSSEMMIVKGQTLEVILPGQILEEEDEEPYTHIDLDIFDFEKYPEDYQLLATYFTGLELYLRLACWIQYKHQYLHGREARIVQLMKKVNNSPDKRLALEEYCNIFVAYDMLCAWYVHFNPERATEEVITRVYDRYQHHTGELFHRLYNKYVDPEAKRVVLWFE